MLYGMKPTILFFGAIQTRYSTSLTSTTEGSKCRAASYITLLIKGCMKSSSLLPVFLDVISSVQWGSPLLNIHVHWQGFPTTACESHIRAEATYVWQDSHIILCCLLPGARLSTCEEVATYLSSCCRVWATSLPVLPYSQHQGKESKGLILLLCFPHLEEKTAKKDPSFHGLEAFFWPELVLEIGKPNAKILCFLPFLPALRGNQKL